MSLNTNRGNEGPLYLENPWVSVEIDRQTGAIRSIRDKKMDVVYPQAGIGFEVVTTKGVLRSEKASEAGAKADNAKLRFAGNGLAITLHFRLGTNDRFVEKWLEIKSDDGKPYFIESVVLEDITSQAFTEIHFHDDQTIWHCPINLFLRGEKGGCYAGLEYPYWDLMQNGNEGFRLGYQPNYHVAAEETNVSEKYFIGVYRKEGISRLSQGPYPGRGHYESLTWDGKAGLLQHFKSGKIPPEVKDVPLETLDWGEVWAMQEFMRHVLPDDLPLPEDGYWVWQNGWWAGLWDIKDEILDQLKQAGVHDVMTAHAWYGRGNHPLSPPYLDQMRIEPVGFPMDSGLAGLPGPAGPAAGLHADHSEVKLDSFSQGEFTEEFIVPPAMQAFYDYGRKIGVYVSSFSLPSIYFENRPEWATIDDEGKTSEYLFGSKVSCPGSDAYMDHMLGILDDVFTKYQPRYWGFDGRWLSYWEVPYYRPGPKGLGFDTCH
ncbi:MAG: LamG domain-containing protein, partial [Spirochaetales bacterium]|nr:LamG domain-containing protein [Spirochaetales bacterium]